MTHKRTISFEAYQAFFPMVENFNHALKSESGAIRRLMRAGANPQKVPNVGVIKTDCGKFLPVALINGDDVDACALVHGGIACTDQRAILHYFPRRWRMEYTGAER